MAAVSNVNLIIHKGTKFEETFSLTADDDSMLNLTGYSASASLKKHPTSAKSFDFSTSIVISEGSIKVSMGASVTSTLPSGRCYYDILVKAPTNFVSKAVEGNVLVQESASKLS